jgi:hypothetical protein
MKSPTEIGLKITAALREYYRYTGVSARLEQRGAGSLRFLELQRCGAPAPEEGQG